MENTEREHHHYWPDGLTPVTPQARRFGYEMPVYVTPTVWREAILWKGPSKFQTNPDKRIFELLESCFVGMGKALASADDRVSFTFKHWFWPADVKPGRKKQTKGKFGARLLLHPETEEPWLLIFNITQDGISDLKRGEAPDGRDEEDRGDAPTAGEVGMELGTGVDSED